MAKESSDITDGSFAVFRGLHNHVTSQTNHLCSQKAIVLKNISGGLAGR